MGFVRKILLFFHRRKIAKKLGRKVKEWSYLLPVLRTIDLSSECLTFADELREIEKYRQFISVFDTAVCEVRKHNATVIDLLKQFNEILSQHSVRNILSHIDNYSFSHLELLNGVALQVGAFTIPENFEKRDEYLRYIRGIGEIIDDYLNIKEQYGLIKDFEAISNSFGDRYIDGRAEKKILSEAKILLEKITGFGSKYYLIPSLDEKIVERHNEQYIRNHSKDSAFDDVNGKSLDEEQRRAVLCDSRSNLTIAGAGAGKTLTICGKVKWLLETGKAGINDILLLSYSKASANDLAEKVEQIASGLKVQTFHSFGLEILNRVSGKKRAVEEQFKAIVGKYFEEELQKNPQKANAVVEFLSFYLYTEFIDDTVYETEGEKYEALKISDYRTLKEKLQLLSRDLERRETLHGEYVKSCEELIIANFLYINGIKYEYEKAYEIETATPEKRQYTPDFYLPDYGIYLEHYGIDENGRTPQYTSLQEQEYLASMAWKRRTHRDNQTRCIETYSYEFKKGCIFDNLKKRLTDCGVVFQPLSGKEIVEALNAICMGQDFGSFVNLVLTFLSLYKAQYTNAQGFASLKTRLFGTEYERRRADGFLEICKDVYAYYMQVLRTEGKIDFDDMILQSANLLDRADGYRYKYVIVDEFQDISQSRVKFLQKIIRHGDSKLFAVGDDWQSIYRFAGCDVNIFLHFSDCFEDVKLNYITTTHRNSAELQAIVEPFITANPEQYRKHIRSNKHQKSPIRIIYHDTNRSSAFTKALHDIEKIKSDAEVLVLGRNRRDIYGLESNDIQVHEKFYHRKFPQMKLTYKTVHQSKGLEQDFVILISGENAKYGFPNQMEDDRILDLVLGQKSKYEFAEERRLFYVALTRTRSIVYILSDIGSPSAFVKEIEAKVKIDSVEEKMLNKGDVRFCPWCRAGKLVLRKTENASNPFYGCSNFPYCKYTVNDLIAVKVNNHCPDCGDYLVLRNGRWGRFIGCHNYPRCRFTKPCEKDDEVAFFE